MGGLPFVLKRLAAGSFQGGFEKMEANETQELQEHAEHGAHESAMRPVAFTMAVLAVLVAISTVLGHRAHTEAILDQNRATDQWNEYQAKKIRAYNTQLASEMLKVVQLADKKQADKIAEDYRTHQDKWTPELKEEQEKAEALASKVEQAEARGTRFDFSETLLEIGLVITSVTLLTKRRSYWYAGLAAAAAGIIAAASTLILK
jgi:vacuolar-type H+-ATPase subunit I/STV1